MNFRYHHYSDTDADTADTDAASATVTSAGGTAWGVSAVLLSVSVAQIVHDHVSLKMEKVTYHWSHVQHL